MATQIHGAGPTGERSPGLDLAIAGYLAENGVAGGSGGTVTATDAPAAPDEGASASYLVTSAVTWPAGLVWSTDPDGGTEPTITTTALVSLFTVGGVTYAVMGSTYPVPVVPDTTDPTAGTLGVVLTSTTADGTVTGAVDETELDAAPYSFRVDAGTWSAWQAGATYEWTGLTASTEYDFQHRVRDAAGNITEGTVVTDTTGAPSSDTTPPTAGTLAASAITDTGFTLTVTGASDETALHATPYAFSTDNGVTYSAWQASNVYAASGLTAETAYDCVHKVRDAAANEATGTAIEVTTVVGLTFHETAASGADSPTNGIYTLAGVNIGTAAADRVVIVGIAWSTTDEAPLDVVTIGGVSATIDAVATVNYARTAVAHAVVPTGATADVVLDFGTGTTFRVGIGVWSINGTVTVSDFATVGRDGFSTSSQVVTCTAGGFVVSSAYFAALATPTSVTWGGVTQDYFLNNMAGEGVTWGGASNPETTAGDLTVTTSTSGGSWTNGTITTVAYSLA